MMSEKSDGTSRRERWFNEGAAALCRALTAKGYSGPMPLNGEYYACPLCLMAYGRDAFSEGVFTDEHVPPKAVGGQRLVLTCRQCNNTAGATLDAHAERHEALLDFTTGRAFRRPLAAEFIIGDSVTRGKIYCSGDGFLMEVVPKQNDPKQADLATGTLNQWITENVDGGSMGFRLTQPVHVERALLSWVRAAYLAAFAALGWQYILQPQFDPIRAAFADPENNSIPSTTLIHPEADASRRQLLVVQQPAELESIAVGLGPYIVLLPGIDQPWGVEELSTAARQLSQSTAVNRQLTGKEIPWPVEPTYALDV